MRKEETGGKKGKEGRRKEGREEENQSRKQLTSTCYAAGILLDVTYALLILTKCHEVNGILQSFRCVKTFAHIVTARKWQSQDLNSALFMFSLNHLPVNSKPSTKKQAGAHAVNWTMWDDTVPLMGASLSPQV